MALFQFNKSITSTEVVGEMDKVGFRPGKIEELLALVVNKPENIRGKYPIIALGSVWNNSSFPFVAKGNLSARLLSLTRLNGPWTSHCLFLAVKK